MKILTMYEGKPIAEPLTNADFKSWPDLAEYIKSQMEWGRQVLITPEKEDIGYHG